MKIFGILGRKISYSFSKKYFSEKFEKENINNCEYLQFDIESISKFKNILKTYSNLKGINVTIPYKEVIIPLLDELDLTAKMVGAVNTINFKNNKLKGYNTDVYGFKNSLKPFLKIEHKKALILGTGGASKAVAFVLEELGIDYIYVSRNPKENQVNYTDLNENAIKNFPLIINCTPLGTYPNIEKYPNLPYEFLTENNLLFDLVYNPEETLFLKKGKEKGSLIINGLNMLKLQAEASWNIWNKK